MGILSIGAVNRDGKLLVNRRVFGLLVTALAARMKHRVCVDDVDQDHASTIEALQMMRTIKTICVCCSRFHSAGR